MCLVSKTRCSVAAIAVAMFSGCGATKSDAEGVVVRPASLEGLPAKIRSEVQNVPYPCIVARELTMSLLRTDADAISFQQTFMSVQVPDQPTGSDLPEGVDEVGQNLEFVIVGCNPGADIDALVRKGFANAAIMGLDVEIWAPTPQGWTKRSK